MALTTLTTQYMKYGGGIYNLTSFYNCELGWTYSASSMANEHGFIMGGDCVYTPSQLAALAVGGEMVLFSLKNGNKYIFKRSSYTSGGYVDLEGYTEINGVRRQVGNAGFYSATSYDKFYFTLAKNGNGPIQIIKVNHDPSPNNYSFTAITNDAGDAQYINQMLNGAELPSDPYGLNEPTTVGEGGYGNFDYSSDDDDFPSLPTVSVTSAGFVNVFKMGETGYASLADLADYLWSGLFDIDTWLRLFQSPMDCILSVGIVPVNPPASTPLYIIVGNKATTLQAPRVDSQWYELDCGSITLSGETYSNSFMDYSPYTKAELYLPYVGTVALNIDEIMDSTIQVKYHIDLLSGSCVAYVKVTKNYNYKGANHQHSNILYQYSGNVLTNIPITSQNFTQILQAVIGAVATGVGGATAGAATAGALGQESTQIAANAINVAESMKPSVSRSGNCSSACGLLGTQKPKLMLTFPKICYAEDMNKERGYPTYLRKTLSSLVGSGFTKIDLAHLKNIPCTDAERAEIITLLESGVEL